MALIKLIVGIASIVGSGVLQILSFIGTPMQIAEGLGVIGPVLVFISAQLLLAAGIVLIIYRFDAYEISPAVLYLITSAILFIPHAEAIKIGIITLMISIALIFDVVDNRRNSHEPQENTI